MAATIFVKHLLETKAYNISSKEFLLTVKNTGFTVLRGHEAIVKLDQTSGPGSTLSWRMLMLSHFHLYGEQRSSGVMGRRNGPSGLRDDDDDDA